jgi:23S rRNA (guanosine2251-2'-O)-methyltransferase
LSHATAKASAGAIEYLVIDVVSNLERALAECRKAGLWLVSLAAEGSDSIASCDLLGEPVVVVVGSEGKGVSRLIRDRSDAIVRIPTRGKIGSLNASVAGAVCLWEAARRR